MTMLVKLEQVGKRYWHRADSRWVTALQDVTLGCQENEFVCVLGPSGCGKSTLLNVVAGFERPDSGRVLFDGHAVEGPGPERGVVFQEHALFPWLTAHGNVDFGLRHLGIAKAERRKLVDEALGLVGMSRFAGARPHALSGGMKQRVSLARILAMKPRALLMDEPFGSLDALARDRLQDELTRIWQTHRKTVLFVTHSVREAAYLADRVVVLGPAPTSFRGDIRIPIDRPRNRDSDDLREVVDLLNRELETMPCCLAPGRPDEALPPVVSEERPER